MTSTCDAAAAEPESRAGKAGRKWVGLISEQPLAVGLVRHAASIGIEP
jgi:hypothetical protein